MVVWFDDDEDGDGRRWEEGRTELNCGFCAIFNLLIGSALMFSFPHLNIWIEWMGVD